MEMELLCVCVSPKRIRKKHGCQEQGFCFSAVLFLDVGTASQRRGAAQRTAKRQDSQVEGMNWDFREGRAPGASLRATWGGNPVCAFEGKPTCKARGRTNTEKNEGGTCSCAQKAETQGMCCVLSPGLKRALLGKKKKRKKRPQSRFPLN